MGIAFKSKRQNHEGFLIKILTRAQKVVNATIAPASGRGSGGLRCVSEFRGKFLLILDGWFFLLLVAQQLQHTIAGLLRGKKGGSDLAVFIAVDQYVFWCGNKAMLDPTISTK